MILSLKMSLVTFFGFTFHLKCRRRNSLFSVVNPTLPAWQKLEVVVIVVVILPERTEKAYKCSKSCSGQERYTHSRSPGAHPWVEGRETPTVALRELSLGEKGRRKPPGAWWSSPRFHFFPWDTRTMRILFSLLIYYPTLTFIKLWF